MLKNCKICGKQYKAPPSSGKVTCSKECSSVNRSMTYGRHSVVKNKRYGNFMTISETDKRQHGCIVWKCKCDCGNIFEMRSDLILSDKHKSCGCVRNKQAVENIKKGRQAAFVDKTHIGRIRCEYISKNNTSGTTGVSWHKRLQKWQARIACKGKNYALGSFDNLDDAIQARKTAELKYFKPILDRNKNK